MFPEGVQTDSNPSGVVHYSSLQRIITEKVISTLVNSYSEELLDNKPPPSPDKQAFMKAISGHEARDDSQIIAAIRINSRPSPCNYRTVIGNR